MVPRFLIVLVLVLAMDIGIVALIVTNPGIVPPAAIVAIALSAAPIVALAAFHCIWRPALGAFTRQPPALDAERRRFQSFSLSIVNLGFSIHVTVDDEFLHLEPLWFLQLLGAVPVSIPWSAITAAPKDSFNLFGRAVRVNGQTLVGPKWCLERVPLSAH